MEQAKDFWARSEGIPANWPRTADGTPEPAAHLTVQWELDAMADITLSLLDGCGIPAFKSGTLGKVLFGFAGQGADLYVPQSRLAEAQALLLQPDMQEGPVSDEDAP
ncbi:hypothetical protein [Oscillibacter sp.]|uniref:hypothetical protein n=1 Tax=Oscillibacter sp. TaxID=1945593 RepID=UPI002616BD83|nr:hypothetical protein [Oscillibacter sp.]MDD3346943.1 hypothetical protein [Oscillibacter sp.]